MARQLDTEGFAPSAQRLEFSLDLRYAGQAFELPIPVPAGLPNVPGIERDFHARHLAAYGHAHPEGGVEVVNLRVAAYGLVDKPAPSRAPQGAGGLAAALVGRRAVWFEGRPHDTPIYDRELLPGAIRMAGPAIVEEFGATTVLFPGWRGFVDEAGNLRLERQQ
jgi:N-methylhydantoinase A